MDAARGICRWLASALLALSSGCGAVADEGGPTGASSPAGPQGFGQAERRHYDQLYHDWRAVIGQLHRLDVTYQNASAGRRDELRKQYEELVTQGTGLEQQVIQAAVTAYAKNPEANADLAGLLAGVASLLLEGEEYEETLRLAQLLLDQGFSPRQLRIVAGLAAFATAEFDLAERHLRKANQEETLTGIAARCLKEVGDYKAAWEREQKLLAAERSASDLPRVLLSTTQGEIELELLENEAPNTVANFIYLVEQGFYNGLTFLPWGNLDGNHTVFGRVVRGLEVLASVCREIGLFSFRRRFAGTAGGVDDQSEGISVTLDRSKRTCIGTFLAGIETAAHGTSATSY